MNKVSNSPVISEAVGVFVDADTMEQAITALKAADFHARDLGLLASEDAVKEQLGHVYQEVSHEEEPGSVPTAFVARDNLGDTPHALLGTLYIMGTAIGGGAVVATAGILGGALAAAAATVAVFSGVGAVMAVIAHESNVELLHEQVDEGHLLLFVRYPNEQRGKLALKLMSEHGAMDTRIISAKPVQRKELHESHS